MGSIVFTDELDKMNEKFERHKHALMLPSPPSWITEDELGRLYEEFPRLVEKGKVFYAVVVQANTVLFSPTKVKPPAPSAATVVFNPRRPKTVESDPLLLTVISNNIYEAKSMPDEEIPDWIKPAANILKAETDRSRILLKAELDENFSMSVTLQSLIIFREFLPKNILKGKLIPIIAAPKKCESVLLLPKEYWSWGFRRFFGKM